MSSNSNNEGNDLIFLATVKSVNESKNQQVQQHEQLSIHRSLNNDDQDVMIIDDHHIEISNNNNDYNNSNDQQQEQFQVSRPAGLIRIITKQGHDCFNEMILTKNQLTIGRDNHCDFQITSIEISRQHAKIVYKDSKWWIINLNSTNGVFINGTKITNQARLYDDCLVSFGPLYNTTFRYVFVQNYEQYMELQKRDMKQNFIMTSARNINSPLDGGGVLTQPTMPSTTSDNYVMKNNVQDLERIQFRLQQCLVKMKSELQNYKSEYNAMKEKFYQALKTKKLEYEQIKSDTEMAKRRQQLQLKLFKGSDEFKSLVLNELSCSICCDVMNEPTTLKCQHTFCYICIKTWKRRGSHRCPICRKKSVKMNKSIQFQSLIKLILEHYLTKDELEERRRSIESRENDPTYRENNNNGSRSSISSSILHMESHRILESLMIIENSLRFENNVDEDDDNTSSSSSSSSSSSGSSISSSSSNNNSRNNTTSSSSSSITTSDSEEEDGLFITNQRNNNNRPITNNDDHDIIYIGRGDQEGPPDEVDGLIVPHQQPSNVQRSTNISSGSTTESNNNDSGLQAFYNVMSNVDDDVYMDENNYFEIMLPYLDSSSSVAATNGSASSSENYQMDDEGFTPSFDEDDDDINIDINITEAGINVVRGGSQNIPIFQSFLQESSLNADRRVSTRRSLRIQQQQQRQQILNVNNGRRVADQPLTRRSTTRMRTVTNRESRQNTFEPLRISRLRSSARTSFRLRSSQRRTSSSSLINVQ